MIKKLIVLILISCVSGFTYSSSIEQNIGTEDKTTSSLITDDVQIAVIHTPMIEETEEKFIEIDLSTTRIHRLNMSYNFHLTNVDFLLNFTELKELDLHNCYELKDNYRPISQLTNLEKLDLCATCLTTTEYLTTLLNLKYLSINVPNLFQCIPPLASLKLKELVISGSVWGGAVCISQLTSLESLSLVQFIRGDGDIEESFPPLDFLISLTNLRSLDIGSIEDLTYISPLVHLSSLKFLDLQGRHKILDLKSLKDSKSLKKINILDINAHDVDACNTNFKDMINDILHLIKIKTLRKLTISKDLKLPDYISIPPLLRIIRK